MKKKIGYTLLTILVLFIIVGFIGIRKFNKALFTEKPNYLEYTSEAKPIHFEWVNDSIGDLYEPKTALIIPLKIDSFSNNFYFQFDTGSPYSFIYENGLKSLKEAGLNFKEVIKKENRYIESLSFTLGGNHIKASMILILENYGTSFNKNDTISKISIGTIGSDFMDQRITAIDFKNQNLQFYNERPQWMASISGFKPFDFKGRRFMLPATINGKELELFYDSGCSAFGLITAKNRFDNYTDINTKEIKYEGNRWGDQLPIHHKKSDKMIKTGNAILELRRISYVDMYTKYQKFMTPFTRVGGWLGNLPFVESTLILDTKKEEFIILKSTNSPQFLN